MRKVRLISGSKGSYAYVVSSVPKEASDSFLEKIDSYRTVLKKSDSIYVYPKSLITRDLINEVKIKYDATKTRNIDKADKIVLSTPYIKSLFNYPSNGRGIGKVLNRKDILRAIDLILENWEIRTANNYYGYAREKVLSAQMLIKAYSSIQDESIIFDGDNYSLVNSIIYTLDRDSNDEETELYNSLIADSYSAYVTASDYKILSGLFKKRNKVFTENQFHNLISKDNCIDFETYQKISVMLKGGDPDKELALTLMSNYNWSKNLDLLGVLWLNNEEAIRSTKAYVSSAFKVVKNQLRDLETYSYASLIQNLCKKSLLTPIGLEEVLRSHVENLNKIYMVTQGGAFTLTTDNIKLTPELNEIRSKL